MPPQLRLPKRRWRWWWWCWQQSGGALSEPKQGDEEGTEAPGPPGRPSSSSAARPSRADMGQGKKAPETPGRCRCSAPPQPPMAPWREGGREERGGGSTTQARGGAGRQRGLGRPLREPRRRAAAAGRGGCEGEISPKEPFWAMLPQRSERNSVIK